MGSCIIAYIQVYNSSKTTFAWSIDVVFSKIRKFRDNLSSFMWSNNIMFFMSQEQIKVPTMLLKKGHF